MTPLNEDFIVSAVRTAIGTYGGSLKDTPLGELATLVVKEALIRSAAPVDRIGHVLMGNVIPTDLRDAYLSRVSALGAGSGFMGFVAGVARQVAVTGVMINNLVPGVSRREPSGSTRRSARAQSPRYRPHYEFKIRPVARASSMPVPGQAARLPRTPAGTQALHAARAHGYK